MKTILVTGGAGFIGSHLVKRFIRNTNRVIIVDDLSTGKKEHFSTIKNNLEFERADVTDKDHLLKVFQRFNPNIVIHLAAIHFIPYCDKNPTRTCEVNIIGTRNVFECCKRISPEVVFFSSSASVYPIRDEANRENSEINPIDIYGLTKLVGEDIARLYHLETSVKTIISRLYNVYGSNETNPHLIPVIIDQLTSGKKND